LAKIANRSYQAVPFDPFDPYNNSNVHTQHITGLGLDATQTYNYDALNRLASAEEPSAWSRTFSHDARGNQWVVSGKRGQSHF